jgi:hypothetical protein
MGKLRAPNSSAAAAAAAAAEQEDIEDPGVLADDSSDDGEAEDYSGDEQGAMQSSDLGDDDGGFPAQHDRVRQGQAQSETPLQGT